MGKKGLHTGPDYLEPETLTGKPRGPGLMGLFLAVVLAFAATTAAPAAPRRSSGHGTIVIDDPSPFAANGIQDGPDVIGAVRIVSVFECVSPAGIGCLEALSVFTPSAPRVASETRTDRVRLTADPPLQVVVDDGAPF